MVDNRDYGYSVEKEFSQTRPRSPSATINKTTVRTESYSMQGEGVGPGQYNAGKEFGKDVKGHGFGKPRHEQQVVDNRNYDNSPEREFSQTRHRSPAAIISKTGARPDSMALQS